MSRILVVDDKEMMRDSVAATLSRKGHTVLAAASGKAALDRVTGASGGRTPELVITDLQMPEMNGLELLEAIRKIDDQLPVIFMTAYGTVATAVDAMKQGAFDYITKPFSGDELLVAVERAVEHGRLVRENQVLKATVASDGSGGSGGDRSRAMIGSSAIMQELSDQLNRMADSHGTVLITGESGSGKEVAARCIHERSPRRDRPFLAINCAALSTNLLESELFGHEKGAFTGADKLRRGRFELADGGTLLLDEISEIAPEIQAKLLRVLQERTFERVGSSTPRSVDVRVLATTNRDLQREVARGTFREDLYFRLNVLPLPMPPLRDRVEDVPDLVAHFLAQVAQREGRPIKRLEDGAMDLMMRYTWPGNVRELQNICERAAVLTREDVISASLIEPWLRHASGTDAPVRMLAIHRHGAVSAEAEMKPLNGTMHVNGNGAANGHAGGDSPVPPIVCDGDLTLEDVERRTIITTLKHLGGHRQKSASALGIGVRTLGLKLKKWKEAQLIEESL